METQNVWRMNLDCANQKLIQQKNADVNEELKRRIYDILHSNNGTDTPLQRTMARGPVPMNVPKTKSEMYEITSCSFAVPRDQNKWQPGQKPKRFWMERHEKEQGELAVDGSASDVLMIDEDVRHDSETSYAELDSGTPVSDQSLLSPGEIRDNFEADRVPFAKYSTEKPVSGAGPSEQKPVAVGSLDSRRDNYSNVIAIQLSELRKAMKCEDVADSEIVASSRLLEDLLFTRYSNTGCGYQIHMNNLLNMLSDNVGLYRSVVQNGCMVQRVIPLSEPQDPLHIGGFSSEEATIWNGDIISRKFGGCRQFPLSAKFCCYRRGLAPLPKVLHIEHRVETKKLWTYIRQTLSTLDKEAVAMVFQETKSCQEEFLKLHKAMVLAGMCGRVENLGTHFKSLYICPMHEIPPDIGQHLNLPRDRGTKPTLTAIIVIKGSGSIIRGARRQ